MKLRAIYLESHGRRPILCVQPVLPVDDQALPPAAWCSLCGAEVYRSGNRTCARCRRLETEASRTQ